jgi:PAS domain S-box-containing protein
MGIFSLVDGKCHWITVDAIPEFQRDAVTPYQVYAVFTDITERKIIEEHLELLFNTLDVASDSVYWMDTKGRFCYANAAGCKALGYSKDELLNMRVFDVNPAATPQKWDEVWHAIKDKGNYTSESVHRRKDGSEFPVEIASTYAKFGDKEYINGFARDITERKKAEEALLESEMRLRDIIFSMADWVWEVDETGIYTYCSQKSVDMLGYSPEEVIGKMPFDFMPAEERERVAPVFSELATNKAPVRDLENWNIAKNGERVCLLTSALPLLDEDGHLRGYRGVDKDITKSKLIQQALQESEEKFAKVFRDAPVLIAITDMADATYLDVNEYALTASGYTREEVIGKTAADLGWISAEERKRIINELNNHGRITSLEMDFRRKDGHVLHGLFNGEQIVVGGRPCLLTVTVDITEHKLVEQALRESEEQYRQLFDHMLSGLMVCEVICDESGKPYDHHFVHGNPAFERLTGLLVKDRIGKMSKDFLSGWPAELVQSFYKVAMTGEPFEYERYNEMLGRFYENRVFAPRHGQFAHVFTDITERKRTEEEKRQFYRDTIKSVTQGKLDIVQPDEVRDYLASEALVASVESCKDTINARHRIMDFCKTNGFDYMDASENAYIDRAAQFESAVGEALANAVKHANGCRVYAGVKDISIWVAVSDTGQGISTMLLPGATLRSGFSSKVSMGMGYTIMMEATDSILLSTGSSGTTIVLSVFTNKSKSSPCLSDFQDTWDDDTSSD